MRWLFQALSPPDKSITGKKAGIVPIENFAYVSPTQDSGGLRHTRSRVRTQYIGPSTTVCHVSSCI